MVFSILRIASNSAFFNTKHTLPALIVGISSLPQITPGPVDLKCCSYSTVSLPWRFDIVSRFLLDRLTITDFEENIHKMESQFPIIDPLCPYGMRRTSCPIAESRKGFFIETSYGDKSMFLLVYKEFGKVVGIKSSGKLCLLRQYEFLKSAKFAEAAGVSDLDICVIDLMLPRVSWMGVTGPNLKNSFAALLRLFLNSKVDPYQTHSFFLINSVAIWGVMFPRVYEEVFKFLRVDYYGDGIISESSISHVEAWDGISNWWFNSNGKPFELRGKPLEAVDVAKLVSVVDSKYLSLEAKLAGGKACKEKMDFQKEENSFLREISKFSKAKSEAAISAWEACRDGCEYDVYFRGVAIKKKEILEAAKNAWKKAYKVYYE